MKLFGVIGTGRTGARSSLMPYDASAAPANVAAPALRSRARRHLATLVMMACVGMMLASHVHAQQSLARGVTMSEMSAVKQPEGNVTTLHATAVNNSGQPIPLLSVRFELYDAANKMVGEATASQANIAAGETWKISVDTPVQFTRFTVMNVDAQQ